MRLANGPGGSRRHPSKRRWSTLTPDLRRFGGLPRQARLRHYAAGKAGA